MTTPRTLRERDVPRAIALGGDVGFDTDAPFWTWLLELGPGWGIDLEDGTLAGTVILLPFGRPLAMVAMMMVRRDQQRRGHGRALMRAAIEAQPHDTVALYATEVGEKLYRSMGFADAGASTRFEGAPLARPELGARDGLRRLGLRDQAALVALDAHAQGAERRPLLRSLLVPRTVPSVGYGLEREGGLEAFGFASLERGTWRLGPIVARDDADAVLVADKLSERKDRLRIDLEPGERVLAAWARDRGLVAGEVSPRLILGRELPGQRTASRALAGRPFG